MSKKLTIGILCGGKSAEHEVSLQSAKNIYDAIDRERYNPILIGINKTGKWLLDESRNGNLIRNAGDPKNIHLGEPGEGGEGKEVALVPASGGQLSGAGLLPKLDAVFPILHGPFGEDGTVQGLLKCAGLPFVGAGVLGSAVSMDKDVMKRLLRDGGVPIGKFLAVNNSGGAPSFADAALALGQPVFVKPANMGSSIGVSKVNDEAAYRAALAQAFRYDTKVILEENIPGRELECSVLGNEAPAASLPGEIRAARDFYSYKAKYIDPDGAVLDIPAKLPEALTGTVQSLAIKTFQVLECRGLARVDFFLKENGEVLVNEINTMPGFTNISMYPKLWEASGVPYSELIHRLICFAIEQFEQERKLSTSAVEG
jgi:D-alanine-D-alanine ligase